MRSQPPIILTLTLSSLLTAPVIAFAQAQQGPSKPPTIQKRPTRIRTINNAPSPNQVTQPLPLNESVRRGLGWLAKQQQSSGGWSQGEEAQAMGSGMEAVRDKPNVGDTCIAVLALLRSGSSPKTGEYATSIRRGVEYVCGEVEESDAKTMVITRTQGTRLQAKLGPYIDTFLASLLLAEVSKKMPDAKTEKRVAAAFHKVMDKIEKNQKSDGTWDNNGWAPTLAQGVAAKALNRAAQRGLAVKEQTRARTELYARTDFKAAQSGVAGPSGAYGGGRAGGVSGKPMAGAGAGRVGDAGVALYAYSSSINGMQHSDFANGEMEKKAQLKLKTAKSSKDKQEAQQTLSRIAENRRDLANAQKDYLNKMDNPQFMAGFGSNGGEEYLSHLNVGESIKAKGGEDWNKWRKTMNANITTVQNQDGTWSGHHCITGRTFCTSAALMVLLLDRDSKPITNRISRR